MRLVKIGNQNICKAENSKIQQEKKSVLSCDVEKKHLLKVPVNPLFWQKAKNVGTKKILSFGSKNPQQRIDDKTYEERIKILTNLPERGDYDFWESEIKEMALLSNKEFEKAKSLLYIKERGNLQLSGSEINK